ncbi:MAG: bifunctional isocitrate dehydrogenase kinase/phosphatase [Gemmatimonadota bacterium]
MPDFAVTRLAIDGILESYRSYAGEFQRLTRRCLGHFASQNWPGMQADVEARLLVYPKWVAQAVVKLGQLSQWQPIPPDALRRRFAAAVELFPDAEIALTFYNSVIRRLLGTSGVDDTSEFLDLRPPEWIEGPGLLDQPFDGIGGFRAALGRTLDALGLTLADRERDFARVTKHVVERVPAVAGGGQLAAVASPFVRNRRAFLVARLRTGAGDTPFLLALSHGANGLEAEAVVLTADQASIVFSFARSYFQVDLDAPRPTVSFLHSLLPSKRIDELYTVLGYHRHGKREFYQALHRLLRDPDVRFEPIDGVPGLVMIVFLLKPMGAVFKVIRDRSAPPKQVTRKSVMARYQFVFLQDHGGRLADTQEFEGLALPKQAFEPSVQAELTAHARDTIRDQGDLWVFSHLYTERRMTPLDVYLRQAPPEAGRAAVLDFGQSIKDLAGMNVFPGDMLTKNFGVTRHGRVVFYDYDEISRLTDCNFRTIPAARSYEDEIAAEPWFLVREGDVFPEEFERFIGFPNPLHQPFRQAHGDLFTAEYWARIRAEVAGGAISEPAPFGPDCLLP